ncbi:collagen alpha-1(III) chain-like [Zonotrichia leucophrys gambelii]|uniref:collagen alpha-1(III) chain-like n=1 Tax=Zonotrichia leucophrys gambelii TaxID=257770 RepID=UPI0031408328
MVVRSYSRRCARPAPAPRGADWALPPVSHRGSGGGAGRAPAAPPGRSVRAAARDERPRPGHRSAPRGALRGPLEFGRGGRGAERAGHGGRPRAPRARPAPGNAALPAGGGGEGRPPRVCVPGLSPGFSCGGVSKHNITTGGARAGGTPGHPRGRWRRRLLEPRVPACGTDAGGGGRAGSPPSRPGPPGAPPPPPSPPSLPPGGGGPGRGCGSPSVLLPPPPRVRTGPASPPSPPFRPKTFRFPHPTLRDFLVPPVRAEGGEEACAAAARGDSQPPGRLAGTPGEEELHHARQVRESLRQQQRRRPPQKLGLSPPAGAGAVPLTPAAPRAPRAQPSPGPAAPRRPLYSLTRPGGRGSLNRRLL